MKYYSTRLGEFELEDDEILHFPEGLYGFVQETRFALFPLDDQINSPLLWLQSLNTPELAFVVTDPFLYKPGYEVTLTAEDRCQIQLEEEEAFETWVIVTVPEDFRKMTANFLAPLVINPRKKIGRQFVLTRQDYDTKHYLLPDAAWDA
ncbi:MAG: flagellar assembly protein FliW [Nitrospinaceae bacterium]|nr:flagellar assembly protein FliW [Nitrospinaceae bacterium]NIR57845.1 flagellar assembly protein FliW [Nitrospinaceae bacterium]NIS88308.1 flagellar assembly protein FliW [Nitrospinaceae bacterium]NIT85186.1 flagellar assembly protein FliW [Nitrospinaceae bacterium]NIU47336.1 flagellar assembly protein FliW [Nitrospinaceae bacterium]